MERDRNREETADPSTSLGMTIRSPLLAHAVQNKYRDPSPYRLRMTAGRLCPAVKLPHSS
jgi:hypothetical protein